MKQDRIQFFKLTVITIIVGLLSRQIRFIPVYVGDILYATMMYFLVRSLFIRTSIYKTAVTTLAITFCIEFSQLDQSVWINNLRNTVLGRLVLGQGFLWTDLIAYIIGVILALAITTFINRESQ